MRSRPRGTALFARSPVSFYVNLGSTKSLQNNHIAAASTLDCEFTCSRQLHRINYDCISLSTSIAHGPTPTTLPRASYPNHEIPVLK